MIKRQFGFTKVRYSSLAKNSAQLVTLCTLSGLWMTRRALAGTGWANPPGRGARRDCCRRKHKMAIHSLHLICIGSERMSNCTQIEVLAQIRAV